MATLFSGTSVKKSLFYAVVIVGIGFFGYLILRDIGLFRETVILDTNFQSTNLKQVKMVTILPRDGIPAIKNPEFIAAFDSIGQMRDAEQVIGVSINGDHRAYPITVLSVHEIVDDVVGGRPIAVTY